MKRIVTILLLGFFCGSLGATNKPPAYAVASAHPLATEAGMLILAAGGNAFDAAVTISAVLAVVEPTGSGLGGGGFWLLNRAADGLQVMVDGRERAPFKVRPGLFLDETGKLIESRARDGALAAGIPGEPAALVHIAARYGRLPLERSLAPAIRHARDGFTVDARLAAAIEARRPALMQSAAAAAVFLPQGKPPAIGDVLIQRDLAQTLTALAEGGADGFYQGDVAEALIEGVEEAGGIWSEDDLDSYRIIERTPLTLTYRGLRIVTAPPPSSGGVVMGIVLNILQGYDWPKLSGEERKHVRVEAMRRAYRERALHLGDPDFTPVPLQLLSPAYANSLRAGIRLQQATPSSALAPTAAPVTGGSNTTHFSVLDADGNRVAATLSINLPLGSGFMPPGTGVLLNNEMDDFALSTQTANAYGLVGGAANAVAPGKRMLSSMSPTFIDGPERSAILGTPGGSRIISMVLGSLLAFAEGADAQTLVTQPRLHHQYLPDEIVYEERALTDAEQAALLKRGHRLRRIESYGNMHAIVWDRAAKKVEAASDPRGIGEARVQPRSSAKSAR